MAERIIDGVPASIRRAFSSDDKGLLHDVLRNVLKKRGISVEIFGSDIESFGRDIGARTPSIGTPKDLMSNLKKGGFSEPRCNILYYWLIKTYPDEAKKLSEQLDRNQDNVAPETSVQISWLDFLERYAVFDQIRLVMPKPSSHSIVDVFDEEPLHDERVSLGNPFRFDIDGPIDGYALGVQEVRGIWHPLKMSERGIVRRVVQETLSIPAPLQGRRRQYLYENHDSGLHRFVFVFSPIEFSSGLAASLSIGHQIAQNTLDNIAHEVSQNGIENFAALRINVMFFASVIQTDV